MASKLKRYYYGDHFPSQTQFKKLSDSSGIKHMGPHGFPILKKKGDKIPHLLGQIENKRYKGITILENNMFLAPTFFHQTAKHDFLCVLHQDKKGQAQLFVRELSDIYTVG